MTMTSAPEGPSETAERLIALLRPFTPFAEAIIRRQAERAGIPLRLVNREHLTKLTPMIVLAAQTFIDPADLAEIKWQLARYQ